MSIDPTTYLYERGSGLEVPGIEAVLEYGDASAYVNGGIPGALRINDRSKPDQIHVTELTGLHDDPDAGDSRTERAGSWGERAGILLPRGRTVGITGDVRAGNVPRMRDLWRRMRAQFVRTERDLIVHPPGEAPLYLNNVWSASTRGWSPAVANTIGAAASTLATFTDGFITGLEVTAAAATSAISDVQLFATPADVLMTPWSGEDVWLYALAKVQAAAASCTALGIALYAVHYNPDVGISFTQINLTGTGVVANPTTGTEYALYGRVSASSIFNASGMTHVMPVVYMTKPATAGSYTLRAARVAMVKLGASDPSPRGAVDAFLPGFESQGAPGSTPAYGPCYAVNQVADATATTAAGMGWANDSTSGTSADVSNRVVYGWPDEGDTANAWTLRNSSTTSRTFAIRKPSTLADPNLFVVAPGRTYRAQAHLRVDESYSAGALAVVWLDKAGAAISTSTAASFDPVASGATPVDEVVAGVVTAPAGAQRAYVRIATTTPSTASGQRLVILVTDVRFLDVSEYDTVDAVDANQPPELGTGLFRASRSGSALVLTSTGAIRRIPRPFLLRGVRSLWDGKAPESQRNLLYRRDFTMSLRASDPRIYVLDQRHSALRIAGTPSLVSYPTTTFKQTLDALAWAVAGSDDFSGGTAGSALNGRTAPGGTWATSGATTDYVFAVGSLGSTITRATTGDSSSGRLAALGSTAYTDVDAVVSFYRDSNVSGTGSTLTGIQQGIFLRYVDASNYVRAVFFNPNQGGVYTPSQLNIYQVVAGVETLIASVNADSVAAGAWYQLVVTAYLSGLIVAQVVDGLGSLIATAYAATAQLERGGTLASGLVGIYDRRDVAGGSATNRHYDFFSASTASISNSAAPTGFTYESASLAPDVQWRTRSLGASFPSDGVTLGWNEVYPPSSGYLTADSLARMYYSAGALTYTTPQVTVGGNCISGKGFDYDLFTDSLIGGAWQYNYIGALLKRVSSSTWIELRYNSANQAKMAAAHASPTPPSTLELWCSHNSAGVSGTTRLAAWDVPIGYITDGSIKYVRAYMDAAGNVYNELWSQPPNLVDAGLIARQYYFLPAGLSAVVGPAVAGRAGAMARLARWDDGTHAGVSVDEMQANYDTPYISSFEVVDYATAAQLMSCAVIGDADDVPLQVQLRGDVDTPSITLVNRDTGEARTLQLTGVFPESDPVTIDMDAGTITSDSGANYRSRRVVGSRFFSLSPGRNVMIVQAVGWSTSAPVHVTATWRDALK